MAFWVPAAVAFGVVFLAEFADKTQLVLLSLAARARPWRILVGASAAFLVLTIAAALAGDLIARVVPTWAVTLAAGLLFIAFGVLSLRGEEEDAAGPPRAAGAMTAFTLILVAELGDKTQIAVAALAARDGFWPAAVGGTLALLATSALAVLAGGWIGRRVRPDRVRRAAGIVFLALGAILLAGLAWSLA